MACGTHRNDRASQVVTLVCGVRTPTSSERHYERTTPTYTYTTTTINKARTTHLVTNLLLSVLQHTRYSHATFGSSNISISAAAGR